MPQLMFSLPGVSAADLAAQLNRFRSSVASPPPATLVVLPRSVPALVPALAGTKRGAFMDVQSVGKRSKSLAVVECSPELELPFDVELSLPHKDGVLQISPQKRKVGRPKGSTNKPKLDEHGEVVTGPQRPSKRKYGSKRQLMVDDEVPVPGNGMVEVGIVGCGDEMVEVEVAGCGDEMTDGVLGGDDSPSGESSVA